MGTLSFTHPYRASTLQPALEAQFPSWVEVVGATRVARYTLTGDGQTGTLQWEDATAPDAVAAVVAAHDPTTPSATEQQQSADNATLDTLAQQYQTFKDGLTTIRGHMDTILAGPASPTAAQTGTALKSIAGDVKTMCNGLDALLDDVRVFVRRARG